jgi:hypothetical protein
MKALRLACAALFLATGGAAAAQTASDAQCILLGNIFAGQAKEPNAKKMAEASVYFYLGRIGNQMTSAQLKAMLDAQSQTITQANAGPAMGKCAAAVQAKVEMLQSMKGPAKPAPAKPAPGKPAQPPGR